MLQGQQQLRATVMHQCGDLADLAGGNQAILVDRIERILHIAHTQQPERTDHQHQQGKQ